MQISTSILALTLLLLLELPWEADGGLTCALHCPSDGKCVIARRVCDGRTDCPLEGADEEEGMCWGWVCQGGSVKCADGRQCVRESRICDGHRVSDREVVLLFFSFYLLLLLLLLLHMLLEHLHLLQLLCT